MEIHVRTVDGLEWRVVAKMNSSGSSLRTGMATRQWHAVIPSLFERELIEINLYRVSRFHVERRAASSSTSIKQAIAYVSLFSFRLYIFFF